MALTPTIQTSGAKLMAVAGAISSDLKTAGVKALVAYNFPTEAINASGIQSAVSANHSSPMRVSSAAVLIAGRGRIQNPRLRAFTYTLDGHDFYVLRLGDMKTLVYDLTTDQWSVYTSSSLPFWRANNGMNWIDAMGNADTLGSNVIIGDDNTGTLWFLDPDLGYDEDVDILDDTPRPFPRVATGQIPALTRQYVPCFEVWLNGSTGYPSLTGQTVDLKYSDDQGNSYVSAEPIVVEAGNYVQDISWMSLGRFCYPGRLFRIEDDGAFARINGMDVNNASTAP